MEYGTLPCSRCECSSYDHGIAKSGKSAVLARVAMREYREPGAC